MRKTKHVVPHGPREQVRSFASFPFHLRETMDDCVLRDLCMRGGAIGCKRARTQRKDCAYAREGEKG